MKKFVFRNESYLRIKNDEDETLKRALENVDKQIRSLEEAISEIDERVLAEMESQEKESGQGITADKLRQYENFYRFMREERKELLKKKAALEEERAGIRERLLKVHNEIKVLEEMKEEQHAEYLKEVALEEAKDMDTVLSFKIHEGAG